MEDLDWYRQNIDEIDKELVELFEKRMSMVLKVAEYKKKNNIEIFHKDREIQVIEKNVNRLKDSDLSSYTTRFFQTLMNLSKEYQIENIEVNTDKVAANNLKLEKNKVLNVGFFGVKGSFSEEALLEYFKDNYKIDGKELEECKCSDEASCIETYDYEEFEDLFEALNKGDIEYGVLPMENSFTGAITKVYDLVRDYGFYIVGEERLRISQNLLGVKGTKIEEVKEIYSHTQGFEQSTKYLKTLKDCKLTHFHNTAISAKLVRDLNDNTKAAIASKRAAEIYGLEILKADINNQKDNVTRFVIVSKELRAEKDANKLTVVFSLGNKSGQLYNILRYFTENNLNMIKIESRPMGDSNFSHYLYIDFEGSIQGENVKKVLELVEQNSTNFKLLGAYKSWETHKGRDGAKC
ncbi:chorismate mutase [Clostridium cavendishii DSM 21758]|uniref:Bifunctional chorismate mutase/prephenate dehydratase n=1 Tax=Clostridium cavendishii DSM 21758 TaxID=1121302 RepID=A0A1M6MY34_9CLOT|nr:chorismate mutase [Clostridium cavendishii]SHJ88377.1 chorismate mutase [Clostridium cavendishii DSM 21758]